MLYLLCAVSEAVVLSTLSYQEAWEMVSTFLQFKIFLIECAGETLSILT